MLIVGTQLAIATDNFQSEIQRQEEKEVLRWLSNVDYGLQHSNNRDEVATNTCTWFLNSPEYTTWRDGDGKVLICQGIPGAGKTFLSSIVIEDLLNSSLSKADGWGLTQIYCHYHHRLELTATELFRCLAKQLCLSMSSLPASVSKLHKDHAERGTTPPLDKIIDMLRDLLQSFTQVYIVVDALDELMDDYQHRFQFVEELSKLANSLPQVKALLTSRPLHADTYRLFDSAIDVEISARQHDIEAYVDGRFPKMHPMSPLQTNHLLQLAVRSTISQGARGMYVITGSHFLEAC